MKKILALLLALAIGVGIYLSDKYYNFPNTRLEISGGNFEVISGMTYRSILIEAGADPLMTKIYLHENAPAHELQIGNYEIEEKPTIKEFLNAFLYPVVDEISLTFLEGWNIFDIDKYLANKGLIKTGEFIAHAEGDLSKLESDFHWLEGIESLEGYLYPDTYRLDPLTFSVETLSQKMLENFDNRVYKRHFTLSDNETIHEKITMASIVEKEERNEAERPVVAGILLKRLNEDWMIGADITVCYPHRLTSDECKLSVTKYLYDKNEYNTRQMKGLPAGPIGNPSVSSIDAVMDPVDSPYYYYLHDTQTGKIYYAKTGAQHSANKQKYLR